MGYRQVPPNTKGAVNAYVTGNLKDELAAAVQSHLATVTDPFYGMSPQPNTNYGGKGAGQQLWWAGDAKGWRVTQPNRHLMNKTQFPLLETGFLNQASSLQMTDYHIFQVLFHPKDSN